MQNGWKGFDLVLLCILFCPVCLSSLGALLFAEEETEGKLIWGRKEGGGARRN